MNNIVTSVAGARARAQECERRSARAERERERKNALPLLKFWERRRSHSQNFGNGSACAPFFSERGAQIEQFSLMFLQNIA